MAGSTNTLTAVQIRIPDPLARWLKARAAIDGRSISAVVEQLLRDEAALRPIGDVGRPLADSEDADTDVDTAPKPGAAA